MANKPQEHVDIVIGLILRENKLLLIQRKDARQEWDKKWEFPGGKMEEGESKEEAVAREVLEETGLTLHHTKFLGVHDHDWHLEEKILTVHIHCFRCEAGEGDVTIEERTAYAYAWTTPTEALTYNGLSANIALLKRFKPELEVAT